MLQASKPASAARHTRLCIWYVSGYLVLSGMALLFAPRAALTAMLSNTDYGVVMPRWVGMLSVAMGTLVAQIVRQHVVALYPLSFFMPAAMLIGFVGMYFQSANPLFLAIAVVVGLGVLATGASMLVERASRAARHGPEGNSGA